MRKKLASLTSVFLYLAVIGCTEPGETTGVAAATGGVIGAGLGAIVGSQTGDPGSGLVIGAAAGAGTGALVGNAIEAQEEGIRSQDEAIERQERTIAAQRAELEELRRMNQDSPNSFKRSSFQNRMKTTLDAQSQSMPRASLSRSGTSTISRGNEPTSALRERNLVTTPKLTEPPKEDLSDLPVVTISKSDTTSRLSDSAECIQGEQESSKARIASESADKLFHYRRAIRLCPQRAEYHNALGEVYLSLGRKEDATFEFKEALTLDPTNNLAKQNLNLIASNGRY